MKKIKLIIICLLIFTFLINCKKEVVNKSYIFPFNAGNKWTYIRTQEIVNFTPDNDTIIDISDTTMTNEIRIMLYNYMNESTEEKLIQVKSEKINISGGTSGYCSYYSYDTENGLKCKISGPSGLNVPDLFPHFLYRFFCGGLFNNKNINHTDVEEYTLKYPLELGSKWVCDYSDRSIIKEITNIVELQYKSETFDCFKIEYTFLDDPSATMTDYISEIGLIKRERFIDSININGKGHSEYYENWVLTDYKLTLNN